MSVKPPFAGMSQEETLQSILLVLTALLEKQPKTDAFDRLVVTTANETQPTINIASSQNLGTVGTVGVMNNIGAISGYSSAAYSMPHLANAGCQHIYDNIRFI